MSENKKPVKVFKKIKHKRPAAQPVKLPPAMSEPDIADADIEALLADNSLEMPNSDPDIRNIARQTAAPQQPAPVRAAPAPAESEEDEFERLLNEFISAELDDVEEEVENAKNGQAPTPQISLPISNSDDENSAKLNEGERSLYRAYQNYFYAVRAMAESADRQPPAPSITAENLYPHFKPKTGRRISQDILNGWDIMLKIFPQELASLNPAGTDDELLDFAEKASDDNLQLAIISYVEILIEIEGCELNYAGPDRGRLLRSRGLAGNVSDIGVRIGHFKRIVGQKSFNVGIGDIGFRHCRRQFNRLGCRPFVLDFFEDFDGFFIFAHLCTSNLH